MKHGTFTPQIPEQNRRDWGITSPSQNLLINGDFRVAQRGTSFNLATGPVQRLLDRWALGMEPKGGTAAAGTISQQSFTVGQTEVPGEPEDFLRISNTSTGSALGIDSYTLVDQRIEDVRTFAGSTCTLSFWARSSIANKRIAVQPLQVFGGGSGTSAVSSQIITLTSAWQYYNLTFNIPSLAGKTIGTGSHYLSFRLFFQAGSSWNAELGISSELIWQGTGNTDFANVQLEPGAIATPFGFRHIADEVVLCQRYYQEIDVSLRLRSTGTNQSFSTTINFLPMRVVPTIAMISQGTRNLISGTPGFPFVRSISARFQMVSSGTGDVYVLSERYALDAEL